MDIISRIGQIQRCLHPGDSTANDHHGTDDLVSHLTPLFIQAGCEENNGQPVFCHGEFRRATIFPKRCRLAIFGQYCQHQSCQPAGLHDGKKIGYLSEIM
jgi:hypothetical protein